MSPGAFWGRPGAGVNPYAAVGAPTHVPYQWVQHGSPLREDTGGYFPPVVPQEYFPFVPPSSSGLANEVVPDGESSAGDTDVGIKESGGPGLIQFGGEGGVPNPIRTDAARQESTGSIVRTEDSPTGDPSSQIITNPLENLTIGSTRKAWTSDSTLGTFGDPASKGRTQTSLPTGLGGGSGSGSSSSSASYPHPVHRAESDPVQTLEKGLSIRPPAQGSGQERRASFAEIVSEGNTPSTLPRRRAIIAGAANTS
jgi:hypothetical protein